MMGKKMIGAMSLMLSFVLLLGVTACAGGSGEEQNETPKIDIGDADQIDKPVWSENPVEVPEYKHIDSMLFENGQTEYSVVIAENASTNTYTAVSELNNFVGTASDIAFPVVTDSDVSWKTDAKYISVGANAISAAAGVNAPDDLKDHGFVVRTEGNSLFLLGKTSVGDIYAVYDLLAKILGYEFYAGDEIAIAETDRLACPDFDYTDEPDIDYRASMIGAQSGIGATRYKIASADFMMPDGAGAWHNSFDYLPYSEYGSDHGDWYALDKQNLCYTARNRDGEEYRTMVATVAQMMKDVIAANPDGKTLTFTHEDVGTWCTCDACTTLKEKYGTDSASMILFMNDVVDIVETWREQIYPDRDNIRYVFFAYTATVQAPVKEENGKIVAIDQSVQPREKIGVMYAPISSDFIHGKNEPQNSSYLKQMQEWQALVGDNIYYWFYQTYFYNYFLFYNNFDSMQDNYRAAVENGAVWMYDQSQYNNASSTGFQLLKAYLSSKLMWDVNADVACLTQNFFDRYFKAASETMYELFTSIRLNYLWMSESLGVSGWIGTRIGTSEYFKLNTLLEWQSMIDRAYSDISSVATSSPALYETLHDRITLESLFVRYLLIDLYGTQIYTSQELYAQKQQFKQDCADLNVTRLSEGELITVLWSKWGI